MCLLTIDMDTKKIGGLGEILHPVLPDFLKNYKYFPQEPMLTTPDEIYRGAYEILIEKKEKPIPELVSTILPDSVYGRRSFLNFHEP